MPKQGGLCYNRNMKVRLLPLARSTLDLLSAAGFKGSGFLLGSSIGRHLLVRQIVPLPFSRRTAKKIYSQVLQRTRSNLLGVCFVNCPPLLLDCFLEDLIMVLRGGQNRFFRYHFDSRLKQKELQPLEGEEESCRYSMTPKKRNC